MAPTQADDRDYFINVCAGLADYDDADVAAYEEAPNNGTGTSHVLGRVTNSQLISLKGGCPVGVVSPCQSCPLGHTSTHTHLNHVLSLSLNLSMDMYYHLNYYLIRIVCPMRVVVNSVAVQEKQF